MNAPVTSELLRVTPEEFEYFKRFKPLHYLTLQEMIRHGEAEIIKEPAGA